MNPQRWERMKEIFSRVVTLGAERTPSALAGACGGDEDLLRELQPLVEEHFRLEAERTRIVGAPPHPAAESDLPSVLGGRFRVIAHLGSGSFGDVYRVIDEAAGGEEVALKTLRSADALALHYFKREFRSLANVYHRNIVSLRELIVHRDRWMFSMEFVNGVDLLRFVASQPSAGREAALRSCIAQLAEGLHALHERNLLHRDLKPSNVLVTAAGRLVLLDFGLVVPFGEDLTNPFTFAGTPAYMSPEQVMGRTLDESSDWYAVGVILYQALTGDLPFHFDSFESLRRKHLERPAAPSALDPRVPADLNELCEKLLEPDARERASYADILRAASPGAATIQRRETPALFVGREEPLLRLEEAFARAQDGPVLVHLCGASGVGKTVLLREFIRRCGNEPSALVFSGRCFEGESVPFQAVDDLVDHIAQHLARLPRDRMEQFLPRNFAVLVKMFPVLARFLGEHAARFTDMDSVDLRTRAFGALREMLGRFAERRHVVLIVDDLQWGDVDGCAALSELLSAADSPPVLVVLAYRSEDIDVSTWLADLREKAAQPSRRETVFIDLDSLGSEDAAQLAAGLLGRDADAATLRHVVKQSGGNPFLVHEIVRWIHTRGGSPILDDAFSLADVVRARVSGLEAASQHLLELLACAGQPTELAILQTAAGMTRARAARDELSAARFIRARPGREDELEVYHDRIRGTILAGLDPATLRERHRQLASALALANWSDPERIAAHFAQSDEPQLCATYALQAARRAVEVLAFNKAAQFFEMVLSAGVLAPAEVRAAHRECADALTSAGWGLPAAGHYLAACQGASIDDQLECNLLAAEQLLYSGHVDDGLAIFDTVLRQVGLELPQTLSGLPLDLLLRRARLKMRGLRWRERPAAGVPRQLLLQIDTCASVATGLSLVDVARGAALQTTSLLLALRAGEPNRMGRVLAMEAAYTSTGGVKAAERAERLLGMARELAHRTGDHRALGLAATMAAGCAWNAGRWTECFHSARSARQVLRELHERVMWERDTAAIFEVDGLRWMGRWSEMKRIVPELLEDARHRGDLYAQAILQMHSGSCLALADDDAEAARAGLAILQSWSNTGFHVEHLVEMHNQVEIAMYAGNGKEAFSLAEGRWPALRKSLLLRVQTLDIQMRSMRARAALAAAIETAPGGERRNLLELARRQERAVRSPGAPWAETLAGLIQACRESLSGRSEQALATLRKAEKAAVSAGMLLHRAVARRSQGVLEGGDRGRDLLAAADRDMEAEGIVNPARLSAVFAPGIH